MRENWIPVIEAAYQLVANDEEWLTAVTEAVRPALDRGLGVVGYFFDASKPQLETFGYVGAGAGPENIEFARHIHDAPMWQLPEFLDFTYRSGSALRYSSDMGRKWARQLRAEYGEIPRDLPVHDVLILNASDPSHKGCTLGAVDAQRSKEILKRRARWAEVAAHIATGLRLRRRLLNVADPASQAEAVLSPSGAVLHATSRAAERSAREVLREAAVAVEKARGRLSRSDPDTALKRNADRLARKRSE